MWKASWGQPDKHQKSYLMTKEVEAFLAKEWNSFHLLGKRLDYLHLKGFLKYQCKLYLKQPLTPSQGKIIAPYRTSNYTPCHQNWMVVNYSYLRLEIID
jgi:hypothetical protein